MKEDEEFCALCGRALVPGPSINEHHLIPRLRGGKKGPTVWLHVICHSKIHSIFTETELARHYNTVEKLLQHDEIQKFVSWISKKDPEFRDSNKEAKSKKRRRKK